MALTELNPDGLQYDIILVFTGQKAMGIYFRDI
jgi:hypothetical protein